MICALVAAAAVQSGCGVSASGVSSNGGDPSAYPLVSGPASIEHHAVTAADGSVSQAPFGPTSDRIRADGTIVERNTGRKDNVYSSLDLRLSREFQAGKTVRVEPIFEVFNLFNSKNLLAPQTTNLVFNFDGTIRAGLGDPRQAQVGLRVIW